MQPRDSGTDNPTRFLSELRELRDRAGLAHTELAARAHYPCDLLQAAEAGPTLPDLPVLSAFVRGCGGEVSEWEDRWRILSGTGGPELLPARPAGESAAAAAGARAGATVAPPDDHDPARIMAVLARASSAPDSSLASVNGAANGASLGGAAVTGSGISDVATAPVTETPAPPPSIAASDEKGSGFPGLSPQKPGTFPEGGAATVNRVPRPRPAGDALLSGPALMAVVAGVMVVVVALLVATLALWLRLRRRGSVYLVARVQRRL